MPNRCKQILIDNFEKYIDGMWKNIKRTDLLIETNSIINKTDPNYVLPSFYFPFSIQLSILFMIAKFKKKRRNKIKGVTNRVYSR